MLTIKGEQKLLFPKDGQGSFQDHEFFEASSIRKYDGRYYFIYSSRHNHELCWAVGNHPMGPFEFGGTLISNGDVFLNGEMDESHAKNYLGNNHGGMLEVNGKFYIFYHRHTNRSSYARQMCAERVERDEQGRFLQTEMTSCGLNDGPLQGIGKYGARIACNLWSKNGTGRYDCKKPKKKFAEHPYFTQDGKDGDQTARQYIANMHDGSVAGFKYFDLAETKKIAVEVRGTAQGNMVVSETPEFGRLAAKIPIDLDTEKFLKLESESDFTRGKQAIYFRFEGTGKVDFLSFELKGEERENRKQ